MARRMFTDEVTRSDAFLDMPQSSRLLYYDFNIDADDDGFVSSPKSIIRMTGASEDDYKILIAKKFVLTFESGVCVIKHWRLNNQLRKDRYTETKYVREKNTLFIRSNGTYSFSSVNAVPVPKGYFSIENDVVANLATSGVHMVALVKDSIGKYSIGKDRDIAPSKDEEIKYSDAFTDFWTAYPKRENKKGCYKKWKLGKYDKHIKTILDFVEKAKQTDRWKKGYIKAPLVFLNQESWNDDLQAYADTTQKQQQKVLSEKDIEVLFKQPTH